MSSTYTPSPTATQAPAGPPAANTLELTLPADGDALNGASVAQPFKVLADYLKFSRNPFANVSAWSQEVMTASDARGNKRWALDHFGLPRAAMLAWDEDFTPSPAFNVTGAGNFRTSMPIVGGSGTYAVGRQSIVTVGAGALTSSAEPGSTYSNPPFPAALAGTVAPSASRQFAGILDGGGGGNRTEMRLADDFVTAAFADDTIISCEWDYSNFTNSSVLWVLGFADSGEFIHNINHGAFFIRPNSGGTNWKCRTINGGSPTEVDSGVVAGTGFHNFRIDMIGATAADDSVAKVLFWIDGALVANITSTLAINAGNRVIPTAGGIVQGAIANPIYLLNAVRYRQITRIALT